MLTPRQVRFYTDEVDIWRAEPLTLLPTPSKLIGDFTPFVLLQSSVPCLFTSAPPVEESHSIGNLPEKRLPLLDWFAFSLEIDIRSGDKLHLTLTAYGAVSFWFVAVSNSHQNPWRAKRQRIFALPFPAPPA